MTWTNRGRGGWINRNSRRAPEPIPEPAPASVPEPLVPEPLTLPDQPTFYAADVAFILKRERSAVNYWIVNLKLPARPDFRGRQYVLRTDLLDFIRTYLKLPCN